MSGIQLMENGKRSIANLVISTLEDSFKEVVESPKYNETELRNAIQKALNKPPTKGKGELCFGCFVFAKLIQGTPVENSIKVASALQKKLESEPNSDVEKCEPSGPYINFHMTSKFLATIIPSILSGQYLSPLPKDKEKVMIEYSQPNTHKAFHVGHMRNAALGDCLVRLYEQCGHTVVAANYFGDEGAHVAKCLWLLQKMQREDSDFDLEKVNPNTRGEWLGGLYSKACAELDLATFTSLPYAGVLAATVLSIDKHPAEKAPSNWNVVSLELNEGKKVTVVCGGMGYKVGDKVAYMPVGSKIKGKDVVPQDMMGATSEGVMMAEKELGIEREEKPAEKPKLSANEAHAQSQQQKQEQNKKKQEQPKKEQAPQEKKEQPAKKNTGKDKGVSDAASQQIFILPSEIPSGESVVEFGRLKDTGIPDGKSIMEEFNKRKSEVKETLLAMESGEPKLAALWERTKIWSLDEFRTIYNWLNVRFDHEFFESEVSEESRQLVTEYHKKGVLVESNKAIGADLNKFNLGFCILLKSDGAGLYATKDLALAQRKFDKFGIQKSLYVVDAAQTFHFKQVFKVLELMGYEQAKNCVHLPYGQVVLPSGRMKSRVFGSVILFSELKSMLGKDIYDNFLKKYVTGIEMKQVTNEKGEVVNVEKPVEKWPEEEVEKAKHLISVATIKYGMLNHDTAKDIVFKLDEWAAKSGNTGPYMMYAFARTKAIEREAQARLTGTGKVDFSLLSSETEKAALVTLHEFWQVVESATAKNNPSGLCQYLHEVAKSFSAWYASGASVVNAESEDLKATRLQFVQALGLVIQKCLSLLGVETLERM
eukprot:TRINITY_DN3422_c0_g1_i1.p1 TRINITY_DN3422_c0_g1~~TRINITY_DN3422_c0_g1_i1.p1  ORF type:complete len:823 (+),score=310.69 TRINITY_DN3422_c0_g1_i1:185-2653(+)